MPELRLWSSEVELEVHCNLLDMSISEEPVYQITQYHIAEDHSHSTELLYEPLISYAFTHIGYFPDTVLTFVTFRIVVEHFVQYATCVIRSKEE
jgi:hypothetical protein